MTAVKYDTNKPQMGLLPPRALVEVAEIYTLGAQKYAPYNWAKGMAWSRIYDALQRHLHAFWAGEDLDEESAKCHLAHAAWGCLTLLEYRRLHQELDDRYAYQQEAPEGAHKLAEPVTTDDGSADCPCARAQGCTDRCNPLPPV